MFPVIEVPPAMFSVPPTYRFLPMPTPPVTFNAPVIVELASVVLERAIACVLLAPRPVTVSNVLVTLIETLVPVLALTVVSVPLATLITPKLLTVNVTVEPVLVRSLMLIPMLPLGTTLTRTR